LILSRRKKSRKTLQKLSLFSIRAAANPLLIRLCRFWAQQTLRILQKNFLKKPQKSPLDFWNFATILYRYIFTENAFSSSLPPGFGQLITKRIKTVPTSGTVFIFSG